MINQNIKNRYIELLSPAKNLEVGLAAINHGADAVYIGPEKFGARQSAGNSLSDIEALALYSHRFHAKVYVTMNTIMRNDELEDARKLVYSLYEAGVDALIVQDMAFLEMDLPPIALHASTQCDTRNLDKVLFFEKCGFEQVVLARESSIENIRNIAANSDVALEAFIHGALCVSYSGQCYMSEALRSRSANRGACAQMCRLPYDLLDADGNLLVNQKHLLSLKDFNASHELADLIDAGVSSFKIEGRLKEANYVKNITAYYRQKIDAILEGSSRSASSLGKTTHFFEPNPQKTFYRGETAYFLNGRKEAIWSFDTPKSMGEPVGRVRDLWRNALSVNSKLEFANGDGLCFLNEKGEFEGFRVNRVEQQRLLPLRMPKIERGTMLYRNSDAAFEKLLAAKSSQRRIPLNISIADTNEGFSIMASVVDTDISMTLTVASEHQMPKDVARAEGVWRMQFAKFGDSIYTLENIDLSQMAQMWFVPISQMAEWRRLVIETMDTTLVKTHPRSSISLVPTSHLFVKQSVDYRANIYNDLAQKFYIRHGVNIESMAYELQHVDDAELMRTRHCLKFAMGWCRKNSRVLAKTFPTEPLYLRSGNDMFQLHFDCANCEMVIKSHIADK